ncbi:hypothetical protein RBEAN4_1633 [Rickettsia bellii str. RML An4]|uniref:Uncharacterized protein n=1 Tax=Rickettsia bellii str. RML An4 TaxID=1359193 RepID=A0A0F3QDI1_RICBE|nr:hypothetical protein RBEAN4_1633 [Rickettsia bellii str. RML An4]
MSSRGGVARMDNSSPCHPVIYELDPVKNTNKINIFLFSGSRNQVAG